VNEIIKIFSVIFISSFKFVAGPPLAFAYDLSFIETIIYTVVGGMAGVFIVSYSSQFIVNIWNRLLKLIEALFAKKEKAGVFSNPVVDVDMPVEVKYEFVSNAQKQKVIFTRRNRRIVKVWRDYGLIGIALITPVIVSIPIGTFIATRFVPDRKKVLLFMFFSVVFWSVLLSSIFQIFHIVSFAELQTKLFY
jgi:hypothetical protein